MSKKRNRGAPTGATQREVLPEVRFTGRLAALGVANGMDMADFRDVLVFEAEPKDIRATAAAFNRTRSFLSGPLADAAADMLAEHRRTLGQLERMRSMTSHLAKTDPLAEEISAAIKGTKAIIERAEGR